MKQLGLAVLNFVHVKHGQFPTDSPQRAGDVVSTRSPSIYGSQGRILICPTDPQGDQRYSAKSTSYVINEYISSSVPGAAQIST